MMPIIIMLDITPPLQYNPGEECQYQSLSVHCPCIETIIHMPTYDHLSLSILTFNTMCVYSLCYTRVATGRGLVSGNTNHTHSLVLKEEDVVCIEILPVM